MTFRQALTTVLQTDDREQIVNAFYLYCRISDECKSSYEDVRKNKLFFEMNRRLNIVENLLIDGKLAVSVLKTAYPAVKKSISMHSYVKLIDCVAEAVGVVIENKEIAPQTAQSGVVNAVVSQKTADIQVRQTPKTHLNATHNTAPQRAATFAPKSSCFPWVKVAICAAAVVAVATLITCLCVFRKSISWDGWQHVIGSLGGLALSAGVWILLYWLDDKYAVEYDIWGTIVLAVCAVVNFLVKWFVGDNYKIVFIWLCSYVILNSLVLSFCCFFDDSAWGFADLFICALTIAGLVCGLIFKPVNVWNSWQHVIGIFGSVLFLAIVALVVIFLNDIADCDLHISGMVALLLVGIANWLLNVFLGANYRIIFIWLSVYEIISGIVLSYLSFDDCEDGWGIGAIGVIVAVVAGLVLGLVFF